ncbi:MAG TPA: protein jag [Candidatus Avidehalobacter gallistercoris]|uniref:RNA-binding protein KhpB n=1 Tax=Candidatus Avidehalobacter gallistercoris TaxID=2840694 RepID=A0A9D1HJ66_9FIRM|nr:protein jag [Candidatus Avidehalobacter gallistercoris]
MVVVEKSAKTVEQAVELALQELGVKRDAVEVEVLDPGAKGVLGLFGGKDAQVRVTYNDNDPGRDAIKFLQPIFANLHVSATHTVEEREGIVWITFHGKGLGAIIGRRGETLDALQYLTNLAVNRQFEEKTRIVLDVEGYRAEREKMLANLARKMADKARRSDRDVILEPMSPHERRIIHIALQDAEGVKTVSVGEEPYRKVIIKRVHDKAPYIDAE